MNQRVPVSILGIQKGETIDFESDDSLFLMKVGNEQDGKPASIKTLLKKEQREYRQSRMLNRIAVGLCIALFTYTLLANELINYRIEVPFINFKYETG